jgi:hypothetical protein
LQQRPLTIDCTTIYYFDDSFNTDAARSAISSWAFHHSDQTFLNLHSELALLSSQLRDLRHHHFTRIGHGVPDTLPLLLFLCNESDFDLEKGDFSLVGLEGALEGGGLVEVGVFPRLRLQDPGPQSGQF